VVQIRAQYHQAGSASAKEPCISRKTALHISQKSPACLAKEHCISRTRALYVWKKSFMLTRVFPQNQAALVRLHLRWFPAEAQELQD